MDRPIRKIAFPAAATGDAWAQAGAQISIPADVQLLSPTGGPLRWRVVGYDGVTEDAQPVDGDTSTVDMCVVKLRQDAAGNTTLARTVTLVESGGVELEVGKQITERDVSPQELCALGLVSATQNTAAALWIFLDSGASLAGAS